MSYTLVNISYYITRTAEIHHFNTQEWQHSCDDTWSQATIVDFYKALRYYNNMEFDNTYKSKQYRRQLEHALEVYIYNLVKYARISYKEADKLQQDLKLVVSVNDDLEKCY